MLRHMSVTFPKGELSVISGKTGAGKSLVLSAIIGEADLLKGKIFAPTAPSILERHNHKANRGNWIIPSLKAYVAQTPWIENASLRDNILSSLPLDEERYSATIEACALRKDLEMLTDGDMTELGTNGINLSGGQKWRVTLARAIYSRAGILVLDDVFSAVDAHVGRHLLEKCLAGSLCRGRTRILVTHHVALCRSKAKFLVELGRAGIQHAGPIEDLQQDGTLDLIESHEEAEQVTSSDETAAGVDDKMSAVENGLGDPLKKVPSTTPRRFIEEESREKGAIKREVYKIYLKSSGGYLAWAVAFLLWVAYQAFTLGKCAETAVLGLY